VRFLYFITHKGQLDRPIVRQVERAIWSHQILP
jgi:hypothetical protein